MRGRVHHHWFVLLSGLIAALCTGKVSAEDLSHRIGIGMNWPGVSIKYGCSSRYAIEGRYQTQVKVNVMGPRLYYLLKNCGKLNLAKIKGTLTAKFSTASGSGYTEETKTFYTKTDYAYNAVTHMGGAPDYAVFESAPAEDAVIYLGGYGDETAVEVPVLSGVIDDAHSKLTILVDLDRLLRFYVGLNTNEHGGVNPVDPGDKAYFICHSVFSGSVGAFVGDPGTIQGYQTSYAAYGSLNPLTPAGVPGWMTLIYDAGGNFLSGMLIGDDDNSLTVAKGNIISYSGAASDATLEYAIGGSSGGRCIFQVTNFVK